MNKRFFRRPVLSVYSIFTFIIISIVFSSCNRLEVGREDVIVTVNKEPVHLEDFQREMALRSKQNPSYEVTSDSLDQQLNTIIDRRLMIQEAMKKGLASNDEFVRTIQTFWEQTLIRELIDAKNKEWENRLFVTEQEIREYYRNMQYRVTLKLARADDEKEAERLLLKARSGEPLDWETPAPVTFHDAESAIFLKAVGMSEGTAETYEGDRGLMVLYVARKDVIDLPPLESLHSSLKKEILLQKRTEALETWLKGVREKAVIEVNTDLIDASFEVKNKTVPEGQKGQTESRNGR